MLNQCRMRFGSYCHHESDRVQYYIWMLTPWRRQYTKQTSSRCNINFFFKAQVSWSCAETFGVRDKDAKQSACEHFLYWRLRVMCRMDQGNLRAIVRDLHTYKLITVTLPKLFNCTKISCHGIEYSLWIWGILFTSCSKKFLKPYISNLVLHNCNQWRENVK